MMRQRFFDIWLIFAKRVGRKLWKASFLQSMFTEVDR